MGIDIADKKKYSERIEKNINTLSRITPSDFFISIKQVAFRFNLDNDEMYLDFPYNKHVEKENDDFLDPSSKIFGIDDIIFNYFEQNENTELKYVLYSFEYLENGKPIIRNIQSTIPDFKNREKFKNLITAFRVIHYNATLEGHYLDDIQYDEKDVKGQIDKLLFIFDEFKVDCALTEEERFSYINITFKLGENHDIDDVKTIKIIKHLIYDLKLFGETLLINPLSEEKKEDIVNKRLEEKIRDDRHTILNFLNAINHKIRLIEDNQLRFGSEILFRLLEDVVTKENKRHEVWRKHKYNHPKAILEKVTEYFKGDKNNKLELDYQIKGECRKEFKGMQGYAYLTIMYNLIHNAQKSRIYETFNKTATSYRVILLLSDKTVYTHIYTPAHVEENILSFISNELTLEDSGIKKSGGIAISKKLANKNGWILTASNDTSKIENKFTLEIKMQ
jgi:hypothetical protein